MPPSFRERQQLAREQAILDAAFELLTTRGYPAMGMDDVAAAVGISKATLYQHFSSKEELTVSVAVRLMKRIEEYLAGLDPRMPAVARLQAVMRWYMDLRYTAEQRPELRAAGGLVATIRSVVRPHPRFKEQHACLVGAFGALVDAAKAEGAVTDRFPTRVIVQVLLSLMRDFDYAELLADTPDPPKA